MKLTLLGHSCFAVESGGYRVVLDPYYVRAIRRCIRARTRCSARTITAITILWRRWSSRRAGAVPSRWRAVKAFHDDQGGALRRTNTIHVLAAEGLRVVHLGDLGHELSGEQLAPLRGCDTLLILRRLLHHRRGDRQARGGRHRAARDRADALPPRQPRLRCDRHGGGLPAALSRRRGTLS